MIKFIKKYWLGLVTLIFLTMFAVSFFVSESSNLPYYFLYALGALFVFWLLTHFKNIFNK